MKFYSYVTSRTFGGMVIPVPAQNSCLREYVANRNGNFILPFLESSFDNCFHQLFGLARDIKQGSSIVMYSVTMLPIGAKLNEFLQICTDKNISLSFVLENFVSITPYSSLKTEIETYNLKNLEYKISIEELNG